MKPTRVLLLGATLDSPNRGIGALAMGALTILRHRYPGCDIRLVDYGHEATTSHVSVAGETVDIPLVNLRFSWKPWLPNNIVRLLLVAALWRRVGPAWRERLQADNPWLDQLARADMAVAVSGGDSFSDIYGMGRFFYMVLPQWLVLMLERPLVLLPQTIGPLRSPLARRIASHIVRRARLSYCREVGGVSEAAAALGLGTQQHQVVFGYDMGFLLEPRRPEALVLPTIDSQNQGRALVGLNVSGLLNIGGYSGNNAFALQCDYPQLIERLLTLLIETRGANVLLVPHVFGNAAESDTIAIDALYDKWHARYPGRLFRVTAPLDQAEIKHVIGQCDLFVGSRMHACIAALSQAVPAVGIAYSQKFAGVLASVGAGQWVADPRSMGIEPIVRMVDAAFTQRETIRAQLARTMVGVKRQALDVLAPVVLTPAAVSPAGALA